MLYPKIGKYIHLLDKFQLSKGAAFILITYHKSIFDLIFGIVKVTQS